MKYELNDLKEGRILIFKNGRYGIISYQNPNDKTYHTGKILACIYNNGGWDKLGSIVKYDDFELYESEYPLYSFMNLIHNENKDIKWIIKYRGLKLVKSTIKKNFEKIIYYGSDKYTVNVKIRGRRTTVKLKDGIRGSVYCYSDDMYNENEGINRAFKKAIANQLLKDINE